MKLLSKRLKKNIINKEIDKTINSLTTEEQKERKEKQIVKFMTLNQYVEALTKNFSEFINTDISNRIKTLTENKSSSEMSKKMNEFVLILDLLRNVKQEIFSSKLGISKKKEYTSLVSEKQKIVLKLTNDILEYRRLQSLEQEFINNQIVSIALKNIRDKQLLYITEDTSTIEANLKVILNEIHIVLIDQLFKEEKAIVQYKRDERNPNKKIKYVKYPHPKQIWNTTTIQVNLENAEGQIHNISQYMQLLSELKQTIQKLPNRKRIGLITNANANTLERFPKEIFSKIKQNLENVVENATKKFLTVLMNPYFELIKNQDENTINYFENPYIKQNEGQSLVFVYDLIYEFSAIFRDTPKTNGNIYFFEHLYQLMVDNISLFRGQGGRLERVKMINWISQIEEKYQKDYFKMKQAIAIDQIIKKIVLEKKKKLKQISLTEILESMPKIIEEEKVNMVVQVNHLIKRLKKDEWSSLRKQILTATWNSRKETIPFIWYKTIANPKHIDYLIVYFSGFFQQNQHLYGVYPYDFSNDSITKFREWIKTRIDKGIFFHTWVKHYIELNKKKFILFNKETGLLDVDMKRASMFIADMNKNVRIAYDNATKLSQIQYQKCKHEEIDEQIRQLIILEPKDNEEKIKQLEQEKQLCQMQTDKGLICSYCGVKLDNILDSAPETYEEMERRRFNQQKEAMEIGYQEIQRRELEDYLIKVIDEYVKQIVEKTKTNVKTVVSNLTETKDISRQEVDKIKRELIMILMSNDKNIFNTIQSVYRKNLIQEIDNKTLKLQIMNDLAKMLIVMYFSRKFPSISEIEPSTKSIQQFFSNLPNIQTTVSQEAYKFEFRLNYVIKIYNQAVGIYNNSEQDQFDQDDTEILDSELDNIQNDELTIITSSFGISQKEQKKMIKEIKEKKKEEKEQQIKESDNFIDKIVATALNTYDEKLQQIFSLSSLLYQTETSLYATIIAKHFGENLNHKLNFKEYNDVFLNLFYWSRPENENNQAFQEYKTNIERLSNKDISNIQLLKQQKNVFNQRTKNVKQLMNYLECCFELFKIDLSDVDLKYMYLNTNAFIQGKRHIVQLKQNFVLLFSSLFHDGTHVSMLLLNKLLNNTNFKSKIQNLKQYEEEFKSTFQKVEQEMKEIKQIEQLNIKYNTSEFICPMCSYSSSNKLNVILHIRQKHNFYSSDKIEIIKPFGNKCPYCPLKQKNIKQHIKDIHLTLDKSKKLYKIGMENRYQSHLRNLWEQYGKGEATQVKMKNLDNKINMLEMYQTYCDKNFENNLKRHNYKYKKDMLRCIYCNRTNTQITKDGSNINKAIQLAVQMKKYIEDLSKRYCLTNNYQEIHKTQNCQKTNLLDLIPIEHQWNLLRKNNIIEKVLVDTIINKVEWYKSSLGKQYNQIKPNGDLKNEKLDIVDQLHNVDILSIGFLEPYDDIEAFTQKYNNLSEKTIKSIFYSNNISKWEKTIKLIETPDGNETIKEGKTEIKKIIVQNAKDWLVNNQGDIKVLENQIGKKLPIMNMEKYNIPELKGDRTKRIIKVVRNTILTLSKLNKGVLNPYMYNTYLLSLKKSQSGGKSLEQQIPNEINTIQTGGCDDGVCTI